jgi:small-conductance mechanosensitive channel
LIQDILENHQEVLKVPEPMIWVVNFGDCAIDFSVKYWVSNFGISSDVMSDVLISIMKFRENNIEIPFPQEIKIKENYLLVKMKNKHYLTNLKH